MISIRPATADESQRWYAGWKRQADDWYAAHGAPGFGTNRQRQWQAEPGEVHALVDGTEVVGFLALALREGIASITNIWVEPARRGLGYGRAARTFADEWAASRSVRISATTATDDPAAAALVRDLDLRAQKMIKRLEKPPELPSGVVARPMTQDEYGPWRENETVAYAADITSSGLMEADEARRISEQSYNDLLPEGLATPGYTFLIIDANGAAVASIWLIAHMRPGLSFVYSVESRPEHRGRGYGRVAMLAGERATLAAGDTHLGLNVFGSNTIAIRLYDSLGYEVIEESRSS